MRTLTLADLTADEIDQLGAGLQLDVLVGTALRLGEYASTPSYSQEIASALDALEILREAKRLGAYSIFSPQLPFDTHWYISIIDQALSVWSASLPVACCHLVLLTAVGEREEVEGE